MTLNEILVALIVILLVLWMAALAFGPSDEQSIDDDDLDGFGW